MGSVQRNLAMLAILLLIISALILAPAAVTGVLDHWQVWVLSVVYFAFFLMSSVRRVVRHGDLAQRKEDRQVRGRSGRLAFVGGAVGLLFAHWLALYTFSLQSGQGSIAWSIIGLTMLGLAFVVNQLAVRTLGRFFDRLTIQSGHQLVTSGIYGVVRHPIYSSYLLIFGGYCVLLQSWPAILLLIIACLIWFGSRIQLEERMLTEEFGEAYRAYQTQTKRLIPYVF
ncbi:MAG: isoprenylcysteine carboxylmethyltransferase family protein [Caldilineaceae bacterium]|nr:isoprenylcysteine carboxylmethyltransferase family protein [Caldilineaceae bacterium]